MTTPAQDARAGFDLGALDAITDAVESGAGLGEDGAQFVGELAEIFRRNDIRSVTVAHMEVPCCGGIVRLVRDALAASGREIPFHDVEIGIRGERV